MKDVWTFAVPSVVSVFCYRVFFFRFPRRCAPSPNGFTNTTPCAFPPHLLPQRLSRPIRGCGLTPRDWISPMAERRFQIWFPFVLVRETNFWSVFASVRRFLQTLNDP